MSLALLKERIGTVNDLLTTVNLLVWDSRTMMPPGGTAARGRQIATLTRMARDLVCDEEMLRRLDGAERDVAANDADEVDRVGVKQVREAVDGHRRISGDIVEKRAALQSTAMAAWIEARAKDDFKLFEPYLTEMMQLTRDQADALGWRDHPYDALLKLYEPTETLKSLRSLFSTLRDGLKPILKTALARPKARDVLNGNFSVTDQMALSRKLAASVGYDFERGRIDPTVHPFEISFTREDVRITTRFRPERVSPSIFGTLHEAGHGLYEQNIDPAYTRSVFATDLLGLYAVGGTSFSVHESQSRLIENHVGRSAEFWRARYPDLIAAFPVFADVPLEDFLAAITHVQPGYIRVEADEVTYDFHVMMRVEIEAALIAGDLKARDVPERWRELIREYVGLDVKNNREGCLQDMHWAAGHIGSFCSYTLGNIMAAQLYETAREKGSGVAAGLEKGDVAPLCDWLRESVWKHGRRYERDELLTRATGRRLDPAPYLRHLTKRYASA